MPDFAKMSDADLIRVCATDIIGSTWQNGRPGPNTVKAVKEQRMAQSEARGRGLRWSRFSGLPPTLTEQARNRAAAEGKPYTGRLGTTRKTSSEATSTPRASARSAAAPAAAASPPVKNLGRTETVALAVRTNPKLKGMEDIALHMLDDPDLKGLSGDGVVRCLNGVDAGKYRASMAEERRKASIAHADAVWSRARASIDGSGATSTAAAATVIPATSARKLSAADARADAVWDRAFASIDGNRILAVADQKPAAKAKSSSADDIWARAYAAVAR